MTILNIAVGEHEIAVLTDSRQSIDDHALPELCTKCVAIPVHRLLVAYSGTGMGRLMPAVYRLLMRYLPAADVVDLTHADGLPKFLREVSSRNQFLDYGMIVVAGIVDDRARAYLFCAPEWAAQPIPNGAWLMPTLTGADESTTSDSVPSPSVDLTQSPGPPPEYYRSLDLIQHATTLQLQRNPVSCGGPLILSRIEMDGRISQSPIEAPAAA
jgi:hypothetical protein